MKEFKVTNKVFIKSNNSTNKIYNRYLYCLIPYIILFVIYTFIWGSKFEILSILNSISLSLTTCTIVQYIFNVINKEKNVKKIFFEDKTLTIALILGIFSIDSNILIIILSSMITIIIKNTFSSVNISSALYGILLIIASSYLDNPNTPLLNLSRLLYVGDYKDIISPYGNILKYFVGVAPYYLSPLLSVISFIYLFTKKSIKYKIVLSYIFTFSFIMLFLGMTNNMNIWYLFFQLTTGNILFLSVFCLPDYPSTPITSEGQIIYGIVLGIATSILRFIIPELSVAIPLILGPIVLTKKINKVSYMLKYNNTFYKLTMATSVIIILITSITINILL